MQLNVPNLVLNLHVCINLFVLYQIRMSMYVCTLLSVWIIISYGVCISYSPTHIYTHHIFHLGICNI